MKWEKLLEQASADFGFKRKGNVAFKQQGFIVIKFFAKKYRNDEDILLDVMVEILDEVPEVYSPTKQYDFFTRADDLEPGLKMHLQKNIPEVDAEVVLKYLRRVIEYLDKKLQPQELRKIPQDSRWLLTRGFDEKLRRLPG